jgi:hypothetical protein
VIRAHTPVRIRISLAHDGFDDAGERNAPESEQIALWVEHEQEVHRRLSGVQALDRRQVFTPIGRSDRTDYFFSIASLRCFAHASAVV